ncbi:MAG: hypothetical protein RL748_380 [Pseudomonadota bacterium]|jgi:hypothetical protein
MKSLPSLFVMALCCGSSLSILPARAASPTPPPCSTAPHRAFDFWLGEWKVNGAGGKLVGENSIKLAHNGCVLHEHYTTPAGYSGESLNTYDATRKVWHQTWVDNTGLLLLLEGGFKDGKMVLEGNGFDPRGQAIKHRISWSPNPDGSVRQLWESTDAAGKWSVAFDGLYVKK